MGILDRIKRAWNVFIGIDPPSAEYSRRAFSPLIGPASAYRPDRVILKRDSERSIVASILNRIAVDASMVPFRHVKIDENGRYIMDVDSTLNNCLTLEANKDQTHTMLIRDIVISALDEGNVAVVPVDTDVDPENHNSYDILTLRVGKIVNWFPDDVEIELYNDRTGKISNIIMPKSKVAIIENPLYTVMNEPNSTLQRLKHKLALLDAVDNQSGSGKLDLIIQLPYIIKTEARKQQAEDRKNEIESQLNNSKFGIAYTDAAEHITQLNRPVENNLLKQCEYLTSMLMSQLGITETILNGTADEQTMINYMSRTVRPLLDAIAEEFKRKFLTQTARTQGQTIMYFNDPFRLVTISKIADIADRFTRNEILSSNELRQIVGLKPVNDPKADELRNKNLNETENQHVASTRNGFENEPNKEDQQNE